MQHDICNNFVKRLNVAYSCYGSFIKGVRKNATKFDPLLLVRIKSCPSPMQTSAIPTTHCNISDERRLLMMPVPYSNPTSHLAGQH